MKGFQQLNTTELGKEEESSDLESFFMKLRNEQEEDWNNKFQKQEIPQKIRSRESSGNSKNSGEDVKVEEPLQKSEGEDIEQDVPGIDEDKDQEANYQVEEVGVRSREKSFELKKMFHSPDKLAGKKRHSISMHEVRVNDKEVELQTISEVKAEVKEDLEQVKVEDKMEEEFESPERLSKAQDEKSSAQRLI